jgi:hypothetical protein
MDSTVSNHAQDTGLTRGKAGLTVCFNPRLPTGSDVWKGICFLIFCCEFLVDVNPGDTPQDVCQNIHRIGGSEGNKMLVDFIADSVKRR